MRTGGGDVDATSRLLPLLLLLPAFLAGCQGPLHGPLEAELVEMTVHDPRNVTVRVALVNAGGNPLTRVDAALLARDLDARGVAEAGAGVVLDHPGRVGGRPALLDEGDALQPGERREFTLRVHYPPGEANVTEGEIYGFTLAAQYRDGDADLTYRHHFECKDASGRTRQGQLCGSVSFWERPEPAGGRP